MILTVAFGKGGTGKTSTAAALVNYARMQGKSVLSVDADPQANFTFALQGNAAAPGLFDVLTDRTRAADVIQQTPQTHLIAAGLNLAAAEQAIANKPGRDFILKGALQDIRGRYDLIVIDTQPDLNSLLINVRVGFRIAADAGEQLFNYGAVSNAGNHFTGTAILQPCVDRCRNCSDEVQAPADPGKRSAGKYCPAGAGNGNEGI